ncbi:hypothetical protein DOTSEDRAFT_151802 [Dothistroma septosporum NZE10]|uniref:Uncharacterized protein n=1 Tax=Dothistroma septosporum (strain NZE10 / CBS 128990) TaxID=675120 RepID=N1PLC4_DOTSN|nr:hypothetical protein DOTSEDRAFT_151802 [Dothistroma septosporum NZE10]
MAGDRRSDESPTSLRRVQHSDIGSSAALASVRLLNNNTTQIRCVRIRDIETEYYVSVLWWTSTDVVRWEMNVSHPQTGLESRD